LANFRHPVLRLRAAGACRFRVRLAFNAARWRFVPKKRICLAVIFFAMRFPLPRLEAGF
jgi:hypothetical protein